MRFYSKPYQGYVDPDVFKKSNTGAIGVGVGVGVGTAVLTLLGTAMTHPEKKGYMQEKARIGVVPALLAGTGAGLVGYLLRWQLDKPCPPCPTPVTGPATTATAERCPPGYAMTPRGCEEIR